MSMRISISKRPHVWSASSLLAVLLSTAVAACSSSGGGASGSGANTSKITVVQGVPALTWAPLYVAVQKYLPPLGIRTNIISVPSGLPALLAGQADLAVNVTPSALGLAQKRHPIVDIAGITNEYGNSVVLRADIASRLGITYESPAADKIRALKGLHIGVTVTGGGADQLARYLLKSVGLNPDRDVSLLPVKDNVAALKAKQLDAYVYPDPAPDQSVASGDAIWLFKGPAGDIANASPFAYGGLMTTTSWVKKNQDLATRIVRAIKQADDFIKQSPDEARDLVRAKYFPTVAADIFNAEWTINVGSYAIDVSQSEYQTAVNFLASLGTKITVPYDTFFDRTFVDAASATK